MPSKRSTVYALVGVVAWIILVCVWATRPQFDVVATGFDQTLTPPQSVSSRVACSNILSTRARPNTPLPALNPQPKGSPALFYRRPPCVRWHNQGRILLFIDLIAMIGLAVGGVALWRRHSRNIDEPV